MIPSTLKAGPRQSICLTIKSRAISARREALDKRPLLIKICVYISKIAPIIQYDIILILVQYIIILILIYSIYYYLDINIYNII